MPAFGGFMKIERKYLKHILIIIILGCLTYVILSFWQGFGEIRQSFLSYRYDRFFLAFAVISQTWLVEALMLKIVVGRIQMVSFLSSLRIAMVTQFFNLITPFYTGGQPFTVYYYSKAGIEYEKSIAAILYKAFTFQIAIALLGAVSLLFSLNQVTDLMVGVTLAGIAINAGVAFIMLLIGRSKRVGDVLINLLLRILSKLRIIRDDEKVRDEIDRRALEFNNMFSEYGHQRSVFLKLLFLNLLNYALYALSAVIILSGIGILPDVDLFNRTVMLNISSSAVPTPGTTGGIEGLYFLFFNGMARSSELTLGVFLWRMVSYYLSIAFSGLFVFKVFSRKEAEQIE